MRIRLLIISAICLSYPLIISALCVESPRPCTWYAFHHGQPTFIGTAVSEETVPDVLRVGDNEAHRKVQKVTFKVKERFEGALAKMVTVYGEGTTNDFHFKMGKEYLVYGRSIMRTSDPTRFSLTCLLMRVLCILFSTCLPYGCLGGF